MPITNFLDRRTPRRLLVLLTIAAGGCTTVDGAVPPFEGQNPASAMEIRAGAATVQAVLERYPSGTVGVWIDPETEITGTITPIRTYRSASGIYCREFVSEMERANHKFSEEAVGCRTGDGVWEIYR
jgi:surface antigen